MFIIHNNLLYYKDININCSTVLANMKDEVFRLIYNKNNHVNLN